MLFIVGQLPTSDKMNILRCVGLCILNVYRRTDICLFFSRNPCDLKGANVMVLFTSFGGVDPRTLLLQSARDYNMSVYFGLPLPVIRYRNGGIVNMPNVVPYFEFLRRILLDHNKRYNINGSASQGVLYDTVKGYVWSGDFLLTDVNTIIHEFGNTTYSRLFGHIANYVHTNKKRFGISTFVQSNKFEGSLTLAENIAAFNSLATECAVDVISVKDSRGSAFGALFWETQLNSQIDLSDVDLYRMLIHYYPFLLFNQTVKTYGYVFNFSINEVSTLYQLNKINRFLCSSHKLDASQRY